MTARPAVAIVVPCYNTAHYLPDALSAALAQTYPALDVIVVNDGSTDHFPDAIAPFRGRVRVVDQENRGLSAARNRGIDESDAELVAFLDADDRWEPTKIARQVACLVERPDCGLVHTRARLIDEGGASLPPRPPPAFRAARGDCLIELIRHNSLVVSSVLVRRASLAADRFAVELRYVEDWDMWLRLASRSRFAYIDEPLTQYRIHGNNMSRNTQRMLEARLRTLERLVERGAGPSVLAAVGRKRRRIIREYAHFEYERGDLERARKLFASAVPELEPLDLVRFAASYLPAPVQRRVRAAWNALRSTLAL